MKVIVAGHAKTGTTTMAAALRELGFSVYDFIEHFQYHKDEWSKIHNYGGSTEDFRRMYENVDACCDSPSVEFWYEILQAFPDAKVILMTRDDDKLVTSYRTQIAAEFGENKMYIFLQAITPTGRLFFRFARDLYHTLSPPYLFSPWQRAKVNEIVLRRNYRTHNTDVIHNTPKNQLLIFNVREGWEKLCNFLEVAVPNKPFPHKNAKGSVVDELLESSYPFQQMKKEAFVICSLALVLSAVGAYKLNLSGFVRHSVDWIKNFPLSCINRLSINNTE